MAPTEENIRKVMQETGMEYVQAYHHLTARIRLAYMYSRERLLVV